MGYPAFVKASYLQAAKICYRPGLAADLAFPPGTFDIFNVGGNAILATFIFGNVTTPIVGAAVPRLEFTPVSTGANIWISAIMGAIGGDAVGSIYWYSGALLGVPAPAAALGFADTAETTWAGSFQIFEAGVIRIINTTAATGIIDWYLGYIPCTLGSQVTAL